MRRNGSLQNDIWAERSIRTLLDERADAPPFADFCNCERLHWSLAGQPPISRVPVNNLTGKNS
jgi:hypothetical protein